MSTNAIFVTGIGTDIGKTLVAAILAEALEADYWKPVQAGYDEGTDAEWVRSVLSNRTSNVHPETYKLKLAASPHIAAKQEGIEIELDKIVEDLKQIINLQSPVDNQKRRSYSNLIVEGAGGLMVPLNEKDFVVDLIRIMHAKVVLVSRNYLGSINHSLLTAAVCKQSNLDVLGWIFNDQYMNYEDEIVEWSSFPKIASIPFSKNIDAAFISRQASLIRPVVASLL